MTISKTLNNHKCSEIGVFLSESTYHVRFRCCDTFGCDKIYHENKAREIIISNYGEEKWKELKEIYTILDKNVRNAFYHGWTIEGGTPVGFDLKRFG